MASKLISALAATALLAAAVPSAALAQDDDGDGIGTEEALGVIFALIAGVILIWNDDGELEVPEVVVPISP
jgi:hypothetical protein